MILKNDFVFSAIFSAIFYCRRSELCFLKDLGTRGRINTGNGVGGLGVYAFLSSHPLKNTSDSVRLPFSFSRKPWDSNKLIEVCTEGVGPNLYSVRKPCEKMFLPPEMAIALSKCL